MLSLINRLIAVLVFTTIVGFWAGRPFAFATLVVGLIFVLPSVRQLRRSILAPSTPGLLLPVKSISTVGPASAVVSTVLSTADSMQVINDVAEGCGIPPLELQLRALTPSCVHLTAPNVQAQWETFAKMISLRAEVREAASVSRGADNVPNEAVIFVRGEANRHLRGADTLASLQRHFETKERFG